MAALPDAAIDSGDAASKLNLLFLSIERRIDVNHPIWSRQVGLSRNRSFPL